MEVSIIIPYNKDRGFLKAAVESTVNQDFTGAYEVILAYGDKLIGANFNDGLARAKGTNIKVLSEDDILPPNSLSLLYNFMEKYKLDWAFANAINFYGKRQLLQKSKESDLLNGDPVHGGSTMYRRDVLLEIEGYDETLWTAEEHELHLRLNYKGYKHGYLDAVTYHYIRHSGSKITVYNKNYDLKKARLQAVKNLKIIWELNKKK